jgi:hypothetical protein
MTTSYDTKSVVGKIKQLTDYNGAAKDLRQETSRCCAIPVNDVDRFPRNIKLSFSPTKNDGSNVPHMSLDDVPATPAGSAASKTSSPKFNFVEGRFEERSLSFECLPECFGRGSWAEAPEDIFRSCIFGNEDDMDE